MKAKLVLTAALAAMVTVGAAGAAYAVFREKKSVA